MDETRHDPTPRRPGLRVSDAERDAVVTELGEHFGQGRLNQAEFDERVTQALAARTEGDLDGLLADLPPAREPASAPPRRPWRLPAVALPLLFALILITAFAAGGGRHGWVPWPLWWLLPIMILRFAWWRGGWRRRPWP
jgi:Domain of unknown function (DUF1707)